jgi:hypothetical protein
MQLNLAPHPATPPSNGALKLWASIDHAGAFGAMATTNIWFGIGAPLSDFSIPDPSERQRADNLWQTTCFEIFLRASGEERYREWNFSPSGDWQAYDFNSYREDRNAAEVAAPPYIRLEDNLTWWALGATIAVPADQRWEFSLSAVLEEKGGAKSYWALAHPSNQPDFHHPDCFVERLA